MVFGGIHGYFPNPMYTSLTDCHIVHVQSLVTEIPSGDTFLGACNRRLLRGLFRKARAVQNLERTVCGAIVSSLARLAEDAV